MLGLRVSVMKYDGVVSEVYIRIMLAGGVGLFCIACLRSGWGVVPR